MVNRRNNGKGESRRRTKQDLKDLAKKNTKRRRNAADVYSPQLKLRVSSSQRLSGYGQSVSVSEVSVRFGGIAILSSTRLDCEGLKKICTMRFEITFCIKGLLLGNPISGKGGEIEGPPPHLPIFVEAELPGAGRITKLLSRSACIQHWLALCTSRTELYK